MIFPFPSALFIIHSHWIFVCYFILITNFLIRVWKGTSCPRFTRLFYYTPPFPNFSHIHLYPECRFLSKYRIPCQDFSESRFQKSGKFPYPSKHLAFSQIPLYIGQIPDPENRTIAGDGCWSRIPAPFSRQSRIPSISHLYPEYRFLSQYRIPCHASRKAVKSHIPSRNLALYFLPNSVPIFRSILGSREYFSRPCSHFFFLWERLIVFIQWHRRL